MPPRLRHCVECPRCSTRYLMGFSPYPNGSNLKPVIPNFSQEWTLDCVCGGRSQWNWNELNLYVVSGQAHVRGYGSRDEVVPAGERLRTWRKNLALL